MMTRDPNPLNVALDLTAEVERLREELALATTRAESAEYFASLQDGIRVERDALSHQLEADRTTIADAVTRLRRELDSRHWLTEGRGSYEWNDDRYREEFFFAGRALIAAMEPLVKLAANWAGCPRTTAEVAKARIDKDARIAELEQERTVLWSNYGDLTERYGKILIEAKANTEAMLEARAQAARLAEALRAVLVMWDRGPCPRKLDEALSWNDNDTKARRMADSALASTDSRAWLDEQIAAEFATLLSDNRPTLSINGHPVIAVYLIEQRIAELRRKEGV